VGFALAIREFDLKRHQPGGTGYPLYVLTLRTVQFLTSGSDNTTMVIVNISATLITAVFFYLMAKTVVRARDALLLSLLFLTSPIVWFNANISKNYPVGMFATMAVAIIALKTTQGQRVARYLLPIIWGLAAGFRPELGLIWMPLVIYSARQWLFKSKRYALTFVALATVAVLVWFWPLTRLTGGIKAYQETVLNTASYISPITLFGRGDVAGGWELLFQNTLVLVMFVLIGCMGVLPLQVLRGARAAEHIETRELLKFLLIWLAPGVVLHMLTTISISGYTLPYFPAILLVLALPLLVRDAIAWASWRIGLLVGGIVLQSTFFLLMPQVSGTLSGHWVIDSLLRNAGTEPTRSRIEHYDHTLSYLVREIRGHYPADQTLLIVPVGDEMPRDVTIRPLFDQARYYLPQWEQRVLYTTPLEVFRALGLSGYVFAEVNAIKFNLVKVPPNVEWLVWFCDETTQPYAFDDSWQTYPLHPDVNLVVANVRNDTRVSHWGPFEFRPETSNGF
jgi:hypothetical protein